MPKLHTLTSNGKAVILIHADDHPPPHFHLWHPDWEALVDFRTMMVWRGWAPKRELAEACAWATANLGVIETKWRDLNDRDN
jgi:hypothetical protein